MIFYTVAFLGFLVTLPGDIMFWTVDTVQMTNRTLCRPVDQTFGDYLVKGHWTEAPWRPVCKEE